MPRMAEQLLNGRYRLLRPLGSGGMATVFLAEDLRLSRRVAVKVLHQQFAADPSFVSRFEGEARMAAALSHANIVQIYDVGREGVRHYIVMEYIEGETLRDAVVREGPLPVVRVLAIIDGVLAGLEFAHAHNLIHRDIKAQNILLTSSGAVKVTDFGIARELGGGATPTLTAAGMVIGTAQYFAPEQARGEPATAQSDVYSAGIVLYEMLTGKLPFEGDNPFVLAMAQINEEPPRPSHLNPSIPLPVETIVTTAMAKDPAQRYGSAQAMREAVDQAQSDASEPTRYAPLAPEPTVVVPPIAAAATTRTTQAAFLPPSRPRQRKNRTPWLVIGALVALVALLGIVYAASNQNNGATPPVVADTATPMPSSPTPSSASPTPLATTPTAPRPTRLPIIVPPTLPTRTATLPPPTSPTTTALPTIAASPTTAPTETPTAASTSTPNPPSATPVPASTNTPIPASTDTPIPASTNTPSPAPTATPIPASTNTPIPAPTATPIPTTAPAPSDTAVTIPPFVTDTPDAGNIFTQPTTTTSTGSGD